MQNFLTVRKICTTNNANVNSFTSTHCVVETVSFLPRVNFHRKPEHLHCSSSHSCNYTAHQRSHTHTIHRSTLPVQQRWPLPCRTGFSCLSQSNINGKCISKRSIL